METKDQDNLEAFIRGNRAAFDDEAPSGKVWEGISSQIGPPRPKPKDFGWLWKAAAVFFFATSAYLLADRMGQQAPDGPPKPQLAKETAQPQLENEFKDVEFYYTALIEEKKKEIGKISTQDSLDIGQLDEDMKKVEAMYLLLKEELDQNPSTQVVDALILNLLIRIDMLNEVLDKLRQLEEAPKAKAGAASQTKNA